MRLVRLVCLSVAMMLSVLPAVASAALYLEGEDGLVFASTNMPQFCHKDGKSSVHCEDRVGQFPGQVNFSFHGHREGCVVGNIRQYEYKVGQYRWDATVYKDYAKSCRGDWWNNNTLHIHGVEK